MENIPLLEAGSLDIALVAGEPAYEALMGIGRPRTPLKIIAAMYSTPGMFALRGDNPARSIRELAGKPVAFGARGSGLVILSRYVLDGLGLDQDKDFHRFPLPNIARDVDLHPTEPLAATTHYDGKLRLCRLAAPTKS